jgi:hypothetical protein
MSGLGALQEKISDRYYGSKGAERFEKIATLGLSQYTPHRQAYEQQQELKQRAAELEAQQAADALAAETAGPQAMGVRPQNAGEAVAGGGVAGASLFSRRPRGAARRSISGY